MTLRPSSRDVESRVKRIARINGVLYVAVSLGLSVATAVGVTEIAGQKFVGGIGVLSVIIALRWLLVNANDAWNARSTALVKDIWRRRLTHFLRLPRPEGTRGRGDLLLAVDHVADGARLEQLSVSARTSVVGLIIVAWAAGWLSTVISVLLMALAVPLYRRAGHRSEALASDYQRRRRRLEERQLELLQHAPELRALGATQYGAEEISALSNSEHSIAMRAIRVALESSLVTEFLSGVSIGLVSMVVGFSLLEGHISLEHALIAVLVTSEMFVNIRRFGIEFHRREDAAKSLVSLRALDVCAPAAADSLVDVRELVTEAGEQTFNFRVGLGDRLLVTGASGSGKTTLLQTILGWRTPRSGDVVLGASCVGYVSVESALFSGSLRENLTLGAAFDDGSILGVLASVGLVGSRFTDLDVRLLADGRGLSTGERVRLALARSLLAQPRLLVIDDISGVLDVQTRHTLQSLLSSLSSVAVIEASVDSPLLLAPFDEVRVRT